MSDLIVGFGLVLVIEGLLWAIAPHLGIRMLEAAQATPEKRRVEAIKAEMFTRSTSTATAAPDPSPSRMLRSSSG